MLEVFASLAKVSVLLIEEQRKLRDQLISDMFASRGSFAGVDRRSEKELSEGIYQREKGRIELATEAHAVGLLRSIQGCTLPREVQRMQMVTGVCWAHQGFPRVIISEDLAAALLSADVLSSMDRSIVPMPWPTFAIRIPAGLIDANQVDVLFRRSTGGQMSFFIARPRPWQGSAAFLSPPETSGERAAMLNFACGDSWDELVSGLEQAPEQRFKEMCLRACAMVCLEFAAHHDLESLKKESKARSEKPRTGDLPDIWEVRASRPVDVKWTRGGQDYDLREVVRSYVEGKRRSLRVQYVKRGHWQWQAHGPKRSLRKWMWHKPGWVGPKDAPIAVRDHIL
jgi:hypothetical protein